MDSDAAEDPVLFFNYHEFSETFYADLGAPGAPREHPETEALVITHFPNVHAPRGSQLYRTTRVVRVPRRFDVSMHYPNFSEQLPGLEPAAIVAEDKGDSNDDSRSMMSFADALAAGQHAGGAGKARLPRFIPRGVHDGQVFGCTSASPLSNMLTPEQFQQIVHEVNVHLEREFRALSWRNWAGILLSVLTFGLWPWVAKHLRGAAPGQSGLDACIERCNASPLFMQQHLVLLHPRDSAYLSLDFQIASPT